MRNRPYPLYHLLPELDNLRQMLEIKAVTVPNEIAFRYMQGRKELVEHSYHDFYQEVRWLGNYLLKRGVRGRKIALMGENTYQWLVCYFAIVTSGNVAVLMAKDFTEEEVSTLLRQTDVDIFVASKNCWSVAEAASHKKTVGRKIFLMSFDEMDEWEDKGRMFFERGRNLYDAVTMDNKALCTIFFTSGTSGMSKAVMLSQFNICQDINLTCQLFVPTEGATVAVLPFHHAFGLITAVLKPYHYQRPVFINSNLSNFMRELSIAKPRTLFLVPLFIETMEKTIWRTAKKQGVENKLRRAMKLSDGMLKMGIDKRRELFKDVLDKFGGHVDYIICGGAALDPKYVKEFRSFGIEILNGYGITECAPVLAVNRNHYVRDGSVGQMVPGIEFRIYQPDEQGVGEIQVKGDNVMMGYYHDEENTKEAFIDNFYRTGDLGYIDKDGFLWVTGRKKNLIILNNGENVSPEGIEQQITRIPEVGEVVVYEEDHAITAEIYPDDTLTIPEEDKRKAIEEGIRKLNTEMPNFKKIHKIKFRKTPFEKTATKKIKRYKVEKS